MSAIAASRLREDFLCSVFAGVLRRDFVDAQEDFFKLGGDSLTATMALTQIRERLDATLATRAFFELRTAAEIARSIEPTASGFDADDEPTDADGAFGVQGLRVQYTDCLAASAERAARSVYSDLGRAARTYARANALAPCVVYLAAWFDVLCDLDRRAWPILVALSETEDGDLERWWLNAKHGFPSSGHTEAGLSLLQRSLLSAAPGNRSDAASAAQHTSFSYAMSPRTDCAPARVLGSGWQFGLSVWEGPETRVELNTPRSAVLDLPCDPEVLLTLYRDRLALRVARQ
jgi:hypothetical protein